MKGEKGEEGFWSKRNRSTYANDRNISAERGLKSALCTTKFDNDFWMKRKSAALSAIYRFIGLFFSQIYPMPLSSTASWRRTASSTGTYPLRSRTITSNRPRAILPLQRPKPNGLHSILWYTKLAMSFTQMHYQLRPRRTTMASMRYILRLFLYRDPWIESYRVKICRIDFLTTKGLVSRLPAHQGLYLWKDL